MHDALPLLTLNSSEVRDIELHAASMKNSLLEFNRLLNIYRKHEARQELSLLLDAKLNDLQALEIKLQE